MGFNGAPAAARVARLADGSLVDLNQRAREARSARSPGRSPRSPGRGGEKDGIGWVERLRSNRETKWIGKNWKNMKNI